MNLEKRIEEARKGMSAAMRDHKKALEEGNREAARAAETAFRKAKNGK